MQRPGHFFTGHVLRGLTWNIVLTFLDDALVLPKDFEDHLASLRFLKGNLT